jgi:RNA polymerase primary sigma factor
MVGEGILGMIKALDKFDVNTGNRFSTYATYWINCALYAYIKRNSRIVSVTEYANVYLLKFKKSKDHEELKREWGLNKYKEIQGLSEISSCDLSLNKNIKDPSSITLDSERVGIRLFLDNIIQKLSAKEKAIIRLRYGLNNGERKTLKEIGDWFGISQERIRQIERKVLKRIRSHFDKRGIKHSGDLEAQ